MIKPPKYNIFQQDALLSAQNYVGSYTNYLKDVLEPAIKSGEWDGFEALDIGFSVTGESLGKIGDNNAWRQLQAFFEPNATKSDTLDFFLDGKVMERNLTNQLKALALNMMWLSPKDYSFATIVTSITGLKKFASALLDEGSNSFEFISFERLETWVLSDVTALDFEREQTYVALNKLFIEATRLPFKVNLNKTLSASDFGLVFKEREHYTVIPQRLYYLGLQQSEALVNELHSISDELGRLSDYIADYHEKAYQEYAKYLASDEAKRKNGGLNWYLSSGNKGDGGKKNSLSSGFSRT